MYRFADKYETPLARHGWMAELDLTRVSFRNMTFEAICDFEIVEGLWPISTSVFS